MRFCIVGTGRCGSTLLRNLINLHPDVFVFKETHWIPKMHELFGTGYGNPNDLLNIMLRTYFVTGDLVTQIDFERLKSRLAPYELITVQNFCNVVGSFCAEEENKKFWGDKTPDYGPYMKLIQQLWPQCKFIHLIRHGIDVSLSMSSHPGFRWMASAGEYNWVPASFNKYYTAVDVKEMPLSKYTELWYQRFLRIRNEASQLLEGSYREYYVENLENDPMTFLKSIANYVDIKINDDWIERAIPLIDAKRLNQRKAQRNEIKLTVKQRELLYQLGYSFEEVLKP